MSRCCFSIFFGGNTTIVANFEFVYLLLVWKGPGKIDGGMGVSGLK